MSEIPTKPDTNSPGEKASEAPRFPDPTKDPELFAKYLDEAGQMWGSNTSEGRSCHAAAEKVRKHNAMGSGEPTASE